MPKQWSRPAGSRRIWWMSRWLVLAALWLGACSGHRPRGPGDSLYRPDAASATDGGAATSTPMRRPDAGPSLPFADAEAKLPFRGATAHFLIDVDAEPGTLDVHM